MRTIRRVSAAAALLACFGLLAGLAATKVSGEEKKKAAAEAGAKPDAAAQAVEDSATANALIEFGRTHKQPTALIAAAQMLLTIPDGKEELEAEGAGKGKAQDLAARVKDLLKEAQGMKTANDAVKELAKQVEDNIATPRGTPSGGTCSRYIIEPSTDTKGKPFKVTKLFLGKQKATFSVATLINKKVPMNFRVVDHSGKILDQANGSSYYYKFDPAKDAKYTLEIRNYHTLDVGVEVRTN